MPSRRRGYYPIVRQLTNISRQHGGPERNTMHVLGRRRPCDTERRAVISLVAQVCCAEYAQEASERAGHVVAREGGERWVASRSGWRRIHTWRPVRTRGVDGVVYGWRVNCFMHPETARGRGVEYLLGCSPAQSPHAGERERRRPFSMSSSSKGHRWRPVEVDC